MRRYSYGKLILYLQILRIIPLVAGSRRSPLHDPSLRYPNKLLSVRSYSHHANIAKLDHQIEHSHLQM